MANDPASNRMTKEESEKYGRQIDARNAEFEKVEVEEELEIQVNPEASQLSEEEIKKRVGEQNYKNVKADQSSGSINS
ncbi:hypothetical protein ACXYMX_00130 [Sporosarcina sp. CAU 1771]